MTNPAYRVMIDDGQTANVILIFTQSTTWTVPSDWDSGRNQVEAIGGGGSGDLVSGNGGGGGAYAVAKNIVLTNGSSVPIVIGAGGQNGQSGGNTTFNGSTVRAVGGQGGLTGGAGGSALLCLPQFNAISGGSAGAGSSNAGLGTLMGGGGGGAGGPVYSGQNGAQGNLAIGAGGGGGAGGSGSTLGSSGQQISGSRLGGAGGLGPLAIGGGNGNISHGESGAVGGGGAGGGYGNISVVYSVGLGGRGGSSAGAALSGNPTTISVLGITITASGGNSNITGGSGTASILNTGNIQQGGRGGPDTFPNLGGGGGIGGGNSTSGTGGQSLDFNGLRSVAENLGYTWIGPGSGSTTVGTNRNATGFGCGGGGSYNNTSICDNAGNGAFPGGGGGGAFNSYGACPGGRGGNGAVIFQVITSTSTSNILYEGTGIYTPPIDFTRLKIWTIGGGGGGIWINSRSGGAGAGGVVYVDIQRGYNGGNGGSGGNGTVSANGWSNALQFIGPGGGGGGAAPGGLVTAASGTAGIAGPGGYYGGGGGGGGSTYAAGAPGVLIVSYSVLPTQKRNVIDVDDLLVLKSSVIPSNLSSTGFNADGQLGLNNTVQYSALQLIGSGTQWASFSASYANSGAVTASGNLFVWGDNLNGQLGDGTTSDKSSPVQVGVTGNNWKQIAWGGDFPNKFQLALATDGNIWATGNNQYYVLGNGTQTNTTTFTPIGVNRNNWSSVSAGFWFAMALTDNGELWGWGPQSIIYSSATSTASTPVQLGSDTNWQAVSCGFNFVMALRTDGSLWGWGVNNFGQLGINSTATQSSPVLVTSGGQTNQWRAVAAGRSHVIAIKSDGTLWSWGKNDYGELGNGVGPGPSVSTPIQIGNLTTWQFVSAGYSTSLAVRADGTLWTWGNNVYGGLGLGDINARTSPTQVGSNINWKTASIGEYHMLAGAYPYL